MQDDPFYRSLVNKHEGMKTDGGVDDVALLEDGPELMNEEQVKAAIAHVTKAIAVIEGKLDAEKLKLKTTTQMTDRERQLNITMARMLRHQMEVAEVYSPPRIIKMAQEIGLRAGWSLDLTTYDEYGRQWDFNNAQMRNAAVRKVLTDKPILLIGSPMCGPFSAMNNINYSRMTYEEKT